MYTYIYIYTYHTLIHPMVPPPTPLGNSIPPGLPGRSPAACWLEGRNLGRRDVVYAAYVQGLEEEFPVASLVNFHIAIENCQFILDFMGFHGI